LENFNIPKNHYELYFYIKFITFKAETVKTYIFLEEFNFTIYSPKDVIDLHPVARRKIKPLKFNLQSVRNFFRKTAIKIIIK